MSERSQEVYNSKVSIQQNSGTNDQRLFNLIGDSTM